MRNKIKIYASDLKLGMYVCELDRPWLDTAFQFQGFPLQSVRDIEEVRRVCEYVYVDTELGADVPRSARRRAGSDADSSRPRGIRPEVLARLPLGESGSSAYPRRIALAQELPRAKGVQDECRALIQRVFRDVRLGKSVDPADAKPVVRALTESILANPDALLWLTQLKQRDEYTSLHCLNVCILSLAYGRHLGLEPDALFDLGLGALLHDIGKMRVPLEILNKPGRLDPQEFALVQTHTGEGREILSINSALAGPVIDVVYGHHERRDGSGYPRRLSGAQIGLFSRMVAVVDVYDAITSDRVYHNAASPLETLRWMYEQRGALFDPKLVEGFIQCLGIFPAGSVVELSSGAVGVVLEASPERRLRPRVLLVLTPDKEPLQPPRVVDLARHPVDGAGRPLEVRLVLEPGTYGVRPEDHFGLEAVLAQV